jgi:hypothetical protein
LVIRGSTWLQTGILCESQIITVWRELSSGAEEAIQEIVESEKKCTGNITK